jgi:hypothetical protein
MGYELSGRPDHSRMLDMTPDVRPGLDPRRLIRLIGAAIDRCRLDLSGLTVLTEAANGAYVVTPVLAAMAGADVYALAASTAYASDEEIKNVTTELAKLGQVTARLHLLDMKDRRILEVADIVTNSGQVRPINGETIHDMKPSSVVPLMNESWEFRPTDVDLEACRARGVTVAGTNERHPDVDVFSFLGQMAVMQLHEAGIPVRGSHILVLSDNDFAPFIVRDLQDSGAAIQHSRHLTVDVISRQCDAVVVAMKPGPSPVFTAGDAKLLNERAPGAVLVQYWGDVDRVALRAAGVPVWPARAPGVGHMGILPSAVGPEPIVRLQAGGLKVGEILARGLGRASPEDLAFVQIV